jgi:uroporphyrinogen decarboxylase
MKAGARETARELFEHKRHAHTPWTFDLGSCKGIQSSLLEAYRAETGIESSLAEYFDYDIWIPLDPDRVRHDALPHVDETVKMKIRPSTLQGCVPLSMREGYDYRRHYDFLPEGGYFDGLGLYYYPWPDNPDYYRMLSPLEKTNDANAIKGYPEPVFHETDVESFTKDVRYIRSRGKMSAAMSGSLYEWSYYLRGRERMYYDYHDDPGTVRLLVEKAARCTELLTERNLQCGVDLLCFYDDLGDQRGLQIDPSLFREYYKPHYKNIWQRIKEAKPTRYIFLHACGNVTEIIPDLIECGLDVIHPIQPEAMDVHALARRYSGQLVFWGTVGNQHTLTRGGGGEIEKEVRDRVVNVSRYVGLVLSPSNILGREVPVENVDSFRKACVTHCR